MDNFVYVFNIKSLPSIQSRVFYFMADVRIFKLMIGDRFKGILSMTGVKCLHFKISQNTNSIFMIRKINGLYLLKCDNVDKNNVYCHIYVQIDFL